MRKLLNKWLPLTLSALLIVGSIGYWEFQPQVARAAVSIVNTASFGQFATQTTSFTWNHNSCTGSNTMLVVLVAGDSATNGAGGNITSVTDNGSGITQATYDSGNLRTSIWYLISPSSSNTIVVNISTPTVMTGMSYCISGAKQTGQPDAVSSSGNNNSLPATTNYSITTVANNSFIIDNVSVGNYQQVCSYSSPSPGTQQFNYSSSVIGAVNYAMASQYLTKATAGSQAMSWSVSGGGMYPAAGESMSVISIAPASASVNSPKPQLLMFN